jgi:uncharacterized protein YkwD
VGLLLAAGFAGLAAPARAAHVGSLPSVAPADEVGLAIRAKIERLRDARLSVDERERVCAELLAFGEPGAQALARHSAEQLQRAAQHAEGLHARYLAAFEKSAKKLVAARSTKGKLAEVDQARGVVRKLQSKSDLSKADVETVADPALAAIKAVFEVETDALLEFSPALAADREALSDAWFEASEHFEMWTRAMGVLQDDKRAAALTDPAPRWDAVAAQETWLCTLALPMSNSDRRVLLANRELAPQIDAEEAAGVLDLNRLRIFLGLNAVAIDVKLCDASRDHSNDMRTLGFFAHESPVEGKKTPWQRAARFGTSAGAENIAAGQTTGAGANRAWWYSPGHHKNMLGGHSRIGLGRSETHWTQMFG